MRNRSYRRRGFTLLEVGVAAALFAAALGVVAVAVARAQFAAASARNLAQTAQEVEFLLDEVAARGAAALAAGVSSPPQPCADDSSRSCLTVQGRQVRVSWSVSQGLLWGSSAVSGESSSLLLTAEASSQLGFSLQRSVQVPADPVASLLRLVPEGERYDGPLFVVDADGVPVASAAGVPAAAVVADGAQVVLEVPEGRCLTDDVCFLALAPDGSTVAGDLALTPLSVLDDVRVSPGRISEHAVRLQRLRPLSLLLEAVDAEGLRGSPSQPGSVCLWLLQEADGAQVSVGGACNGSDPQMVEFFTLMPDLSRPHALAAFPSGEPVSVATALPDGSCPALPGARLPRSAGWLEPGEGEQGACAGYVWGEPTLFRASPTATAVPFADASLQVEAEEPMPLPVVSWSALGPSPLASGLSLPAAGSVGGSRVARLWAVPHECPAAGDCSASATPQASSFVSPAFLDLPVAGSFGLPSLPLAPGAQAELDLTVSSPSGAPVSLQLLQLPAGLSLQVYDDTELVAWQADPAPSGPEPDPWQDVSAGETLPPDPYADGSSLRLRLTAGASFSGGLLRLQLDDGSAVAEPLWLDAGAVGVAAAYLPSLTLFQADPALFPLLAVGWDGELWTSASLPAGSGAPAGVSLSLQQASPLLQVDVSARSAPASVSSVSFALPGFTVSAQLTVRSSPALLSFPAAVVSALGSPLLQGGSLQLALQAEDLAGDPLEGWPLWLLSSDAAGLPSRGLGAEEVACVTSSAGACQLTLAAADAAAPGVYRLRLAAGGSSLRNVSPLLSFQLDPNVVGLLVEGVTGSPGGVVSAAASVSDASGRPASGVTLSVSGLPSGVTATLSGPSSASGLVVVDLSLPLSLPAGAYTYTVSLPSGSSVTAQLQVSPLSVSVLASTPVQVGVGGSAAVSLQVSLPSGAAASARALEAVSPQDGLLADVVSLTDGSGQALLAFSVAEDFAGSLPSATLMVELFSASQKVGEVPVQVLPGLSAAERFGAVVAGASSQVSFTLSDASGDPIASRQVVVSFPEASAVQLSASASPCPLDAGLICTDGDGLLQLTLQASEAATSALMGLTVDGVLLEVPLEVAR